MSSAECVPVIRSEAEFASAVTLLQQLHKEKPLDRARLGSLAATIAAYEARLLTHLEPEPLAAIRVRLGDLGWDVDDFAARLGANPEQIRGCLDGTREASASLVLRIAEASSLPVGLIARALSLSSGDTQPEPFASGAVVAPKRAEGGAATAH